jgi:hypothetical protein
VDRFQSEEIVMKADCLVEKRVTYTLEFGWRVFVEENAPPRIDEETGEQYFAAATVERLHELIRGKQEPDRVMEIPVYNYADREGKQGQTTVFAVAKS